MFCYKKIRANASGCCIFGHFWMSFLQKKTCFYWSFVWFTSVNDVLRRSSIFCINLLVFILLSDVFFLTIQDLYTNLTGEKDVLMYFFLLYIKHVIIILVGLWTHELIQASHLQSSVNWYLFLSKLILFNGCCKSDAACKTNVVH